MAARKVFQCERCGKQFRDHYIGPNRFCSIECRAQAARVRPQRSCEMCGGRYWPHGDTARYCSDSCRTQARRRPDYYAVCEICRRQFVRNSGRDAANRFCSRACYLIFHGSRPKAVRECSHCGATLRFTSSWLKRGRRLFCDERCRKIGLKATPRHCRWCRTWFTPLKYDRRRGRFISNGAGKMCSDACVRDAYRFGEERKRKIGRASTGTRHWNWKGGISYIRKLGHRGPGWVALAEEVRKRAGRCCEHCGKSESELRRRLDVHHRIPFHDFPTAREENRLTNLIALCKACHRRHEPRAAQMLLPFAKRRRMRMSA